MGEIAGKAKMPSLKFAFPPNGDQSLKANQAFTIKANLKNLDVRATPYYWYLTTLIRSCRPVISSTHSRTISRYEPLTSSLRFPLIESSSMQAPQRLNAQGVIIGHSHFVIEAIPSLGSTAPTNPQAFAFFKGVDTAADANGQLTVAVTAGLPAGVYRLASLNSASNHQPVLVNIAQHGFLDDAVYVGPRS